VQQEITKVVQTNTVIYSRRSKDMKVSDVIAISSSSGTVKAGLESFKRLNELDFD
jgi:hypothetical protein